MAFYISLHECLSSGQHLSSCDRDGYCNSCGEQTAGGICKVCKEPFLLIDDDDDKPHHITETGHIDYKRDNDHPVEPS